jgi:hypothetical protein
LCDSHVAEGITFRIWQPDAVDRVTQEARSEERLAKHPPSRRRAPQTQTKDSGVPPHTGQYRPGHPSAPVAATSRLGEDRYRPGGRRTAAEPLRASWQPHAEPGDDDENGPSQSEGKQPRRGKLGKLTKAYGWRAYALPILVVFTVLIVFNTANSPAQPISDQPKQSTLSAGGTGAYGDTGVSLPENPATPVDLNIPTADLPEGSAFTPAGKGTYHVVPGTGGKVGTGKLYTYTVEVEDGINPASYAGDDSFAVAVQSTLSDPKSWTWDGKFAFQRVDASFPNPSFKVSLTTPETTHRADMCGYQIKAEASCYRYSVGRVVINLARWVRGAKAFSGDLGLYRQYAINHEVGHALGGVHIGCTTNGALAPVMMQQSFGVNDDYVAKLNDTPGGDKGRVPADGKVCRPNAWPNPAPG